MTVRPSAVDLSDPAQARGRCYTESRAVAEREGVLLVRATGATYNREHWAVLRVAAVDALSGDEPVLDLTARQFAPHDQPSPWHGSLDDWLDDAAEWLRDSLFYEVQTPDVWHPEVLFRDTWNREDLDAEGGA